MWGCVVDNWVLFLGIYALVGANETQVASFYSKYYSKISVEFAVRVVYTTYGNTKTRMNQE